MRDEKRPERSVRDNKLELVQTVDRKIRANRGLSMIADELDISLLSGCA